MYEVMFVAGAILAGIFLIIAIVFFIKDDVAKRIGDVTGWTAKREIKKRIQIGAETVSKNEALHAKDEDIVVKNLELSEEEATELLAEEETMLLADEATELLVDEETMLLADEATELLVDEETMLLANEETELLVDEETTILAKDETELLAKGYNSSFAKSTETYSKGAEMPSIFEVEEETVVVHTEESI